MSTYKRGTHTFIVEKTNIDNSIHFRLTVTPKMTDEEYDALKYRIEKLGGHWRERFGGFIFDEDPMDKLKDESTWGSFEQSDYTRWKIMRQFYPTPADVAKRVIELCEIEDNNSVLEPSAGTGALINSLSNKSRITAIEIDPGMANGLKTAGYHVFNESFEDAIMCAHIDKFDRIVMNPPFSRQRDIKHIMAAYALLDDGGVLVGIMSENDLYYKTPLTERFNEFLKDIDAYIEPVPMRSFAESGTMVDTVIVKIKKA